jgi:hypothetical protein
MQFYNSVNKLCRIEVLLRILFNKKFYSIIHIILFFIEYFLNFLVNNAIYYFYYILIN